MTVEYNDSAADHIKMPDYNVAEYYVWDLETTMY